MRAKRFALRCYQRAQRLALDYADDVARLFMLKTIMGMLLSRHRDTAAASMTRRFRRRIRRRRSPGIW